MTSELGTSPKTECLQPAPGPPRGSESYLERLETALEISVRSTFKGIDFFYGLHFSKGPNGILAAVHDSMQELHSTGIEVNSNIHTSGNLIWAHSHGSDVRAATRHASSMTLFSAHVTTDSFEGSLRGYRMSRQLIERWLRTGYDTADLVLAPSAAAAEELRAMGLHVPIKVVAPTIHQSALGPIPEKLAARRSLNLDPERQIVLGSGQLQPRKGVLEFFLLAKRMPDLDFVWVGGKTLGALGSRWNASTRMHMPRNGRIIGSLPREQLGSYYSAADAFVSLSHHETFGLSVAEAKMFGLPLVLRDLEVFHELHPNATFVSTDDPIDATITALRSLLSRDESEILRPSP